MTLTHSHLWSCLCKQMRLASIHRESDFITSWTIYQNIATNIHLFCAISIDEVAINSKFKAFITLPMSFGMKNLISGHLNKDFLLFNIIIFYNRINSFFFSLNKQSVSIKKRVSWKCISKNGNNFIKALNLTNWSSPVLNSNYVSGVNRRHSSVFGRVAVVRVWIIE